MTTSCSTISAALLFAALLVLQPPSTLASPRISEDERVGSAVRRARADFLARQPFERLHVAVLVEAEPGRWLMGESEGHVPAYPASCVKLAFLVGAVHWCASRGAAPDCLDSLVRPMIVESDNIATGELVDVVTGTRNAPDAGVEFDAWLERRRYFEQRLAAADLLQGQTLFTKTYPSNSGDAPQGLEARARVQLGPNQMTAVGAASLMLAIVSGDLEPQARDYVRMLLRRPAVSAHSSLGGGLSPGSVHENKLGTAFDTLQDIMYAELPNGRRLIIAAFSNGWNRRESSPGDVARLGRFTELLIRHLELDAGVPTSRVSRARDDAAGPDWSHASHGSSFDAGGYLRSEAGSVGELRWRPQAIDGGRYVVSLWHPVDPSLSARVDVALEHARGVARWQLDQRQWGGRWIQLGEFDLTQQRGTLRLRARDGLPTAADAIRLAPVFPVMRHRHVPPKSTRSQRVDLESERKPRFSLAEVEKGQEYLFQQPASAPPDRSTAAAGMDPQ